MAKLTLIWWLAPADPGPWSATSASMMGSTSDGFDLAQPSRQ
jgi:hypothetical protein